MNKSKINTFCKFFVVFTMFLLFYLIPNNLGVSAKELVEEKDINIKVHNGDEAKLLKTSSSKAYLLTVDSYPLAGGISIGVSTKGSAMQQVTVKITAYGTNGSIDSKTGKVSYQGITKKVKTFYNVQPWTNKQIAFVDLPVRSLNTKYKFEITARTKKGDLNKGSSTGYYHVKKNKYSNWNKGTFVSTPASIEFHNKKHGKDKYVQAVNIEDYLNKAKAFHSKVKKLKKVPRIIN